MVNSFEIEAQVRSSTGTSLARAMRRQNKVPAVLYGGDAEPLLLVLDHNKVDKQLKNEAFFSHVLDIKVKGEKAKEKAILKGVQRHPSQPVILHLDFQRVTKTDKIRIRVPLHFVGEDEAVGVKKGGFVTRNLVDLDVSCLADDLPEFIEVDISALDIGQAVYLSEVKLPQGIEVLALGHEGDHDAPVVTIQVERETEDEPEAADEEAVDVAEIPKEE